MLLAGLAMGVQAAVGSTYNFAPELYLELIEAFKMGDIAKARDLQSQSVDMINILVSSCGRSGLKAAMTLSGIHCGRHRLPISDPTPEQLNKMKQQLSDAGFLKWIRR